MKYNRHLPAIQSIISDSGVVVKDRPSIHHPIPVSVFYRQKADGSVYTLWPKGNRYAGSSQLHKVFSALGLESFFAHGKATLYTDLPTATYLQQQWRRN
jgi:hypothetical protein